MLIILIAVLIVLSGCDLMPNDPSELKKVKSMVKEKLIDPESAQFSELKFYKSTKSGCGYVNAKNQFGGFTGRKRFVVLLEKDVVAIAPDTDTKISAIPIIPDVPAILPNSVTSNNNAQYLQIASDWYSTVTKIDRDNRKFESLDLESCTDSLPEQDENESVLQKQFQRIDNLFATALDHAIKEDAAFKNTIQHIEKENASLLIKKAQLSGLSGLNWAEANNAIAKKKINLKILGFDANKSLILSQEKLAGAIKAYIALRELKAAIDRGAGIEDIEKAQLEVDVSIQIVEDLEKLAKTVN